MTSIVEILNRLLQKTKLIVVLLGLVFCSSVYAETICSCNPLKTNQQPPNIGNFALPFSQQLGPLLSFGQNMIDPNQNQFFVLATDGVGANKNSVDLSSSLLYQMTDNLSILANLPIAAHYYEDTNRSSGLGDALLQLEYAFYSRQTNRLVDQATVVTNLTFPTGSTKKQPNTGVGSTSFFLGTTFSRTTVDWYGFTSDGVVINTHKNSNTFGNEFLYQLGMGRNLLTLGHCWLFALLVELDGQYT